MTIRKRIGAVALGLAAVLLMGGFPLAAQEPATSKPAAPAAKKKDPSRRVPPHFGQIGLTTEQRASIYGFQAKRMEKIEALEKQIAAEKAELLADCEGVLNETQKKLLDNLRKAAAEPAPKPAASGKTAENSIESKPLELYARPYPSIPRPAQRNSAHARRRLGVPLRPNWARLLYSVSLRRRGPNFTTAWTSIRRSGQSGRRLVWGEFALCR